MTRLRLTTLALLLGLAAPAYAQDAVLDSARTAGQVGEGADGYLAARPGASADVRARVEQVNIKRRAAYTDLAAKRGVSVGEVAGAAACQLLESTAANEWYRDASGSWRQRTGGAAVSKPAFCG